MASECNNTGSTVHTDGGSVNLDQYYTTPMHIGVSFYISFLNCLCNISVSASATIYARYYLYVGL